MILARTQLLRRRLARPGHVVSAADLDGLAVVERAARDLARRVDHIGRSDAKPHDPDAGP